MRTLKISLVATIASMMAWQLRLPHRISPTHPYLMDVLLALILCVVLQFAWADPKRETKNENVKQPSPGEFESKKTSPSRTN